MLFLLTFNLLDFIEDTKFVVSAFFVKLFSVYTSCLRTSNFLLVFFLFFFLFSSCFSSCFLLVFFLFFFLFSYCFSSCFSSCFFSCFFPVDGTFSNRSGAYICLSGAFWKFLIFMHIYSSIFQFSTKNSELFSILIKFFLLTNNLFFYLKQLITKLNPFEAFYFSTTF